MTKRRQNLSSPAGPLYRASVNRLGYTPKAWTGLSPHVVRDNSGFLERTSKFRAIQPIASKSPRRSTFDPSNEGITSIFQNHFYTQPLLASRFSVNKRLASRSYLNERLFPPFQGTAGFPVNEQLASLPPSRNGFKMANIGRCAYVEHAT
ncbi:hypothetical protein B0H14DRAFT_2624585 [Mycena olivaceomarginata]|nr:hypothetical protein B0H14DRAFT_2624585 [Mycena olivaceomarginata]